MASRNIVGIVGIVGGGGYLRDTLFNYGCAVIVCRSEDVDLEAEFEQNELNSAVYLISMAMQISNFAVNYKVRTWTCTTRGGGKGV